MRTVSILVLTLSSLLVSVAQGAPDPIRMEVMAGSSVAGVIPASPGEEKQPGGGEQARAGWILQQTVGSVLKAVSFADPLNGYAAAELGAVYRTTNGGATWTRVMNVGFPYYWYGVQAFSPQTALVVGFQNQSGAGVARWTDNGGATWTGDIVIDPANWLIGLKFADAQHGIAYGNLGYVYVTQNGGRNATDWTKVTTDPNHGWLAGNFTFRPDMNAFITGITFCHSTDGGLTWTVRHSADPVFDGGCSFPDLMHGWTGGGQISTPVSGWVHRTTDGGETWSDRLMQPSYPIRIVQFFDESFGFAAGGNIYSGAGGIWSTTDAGTTWSLDINTGAEMAAIDFKPVSADSTDVWCVGFLPNFSGVIYKKRIVRREPAGVGAPTPPAGLVARAVPNPFFDRTEVHLPGRSAIVVDLSGRLVRSLSASGPGIFRWDGRDEAGRLVPAGIYLVQPDRGTGTPVRLLRMR